MKNIAETLNTLLIVLAALQFRYRPFMELRTGLMENVYEFSELETEEPWRGQDSKYLHLLTEIENESAELQVRIREVMAEISRSRSQSHLQWLRDARKMQEDLTRLQKNVRTTIKNLKGRSIKQLLMRSYFNRSTLVPKQSTETSPRGFYSSPDIPSMLEELEFKSAQKWKSENRSIEFKNPVVEKIEDLAEMFANLKQLQNNVVNPLLLKDIDPRLQNISQELDAHDTTVEQNHSLTNESEFHLNQVPSRSTRYFPHPLSSEDSDDELDVHDTMVEQNHSLTNESEFHLNQTSSGITNNGTSSPGDYPSNNPRPRARRSSAFSWCTIL